MSRFAVHGYSLAVGLAGIALLVSVPGRISPRNALPLLLFASLSLLIKRMGFHVFDEAGSRAPSLAPHHLPVKVTHSLVGVIDLAALLLYGPFTGGWVAAFSEFTYLMFRRPRGAWRWKQRGEIALFNAGLKVLMALTSGTIYGALGACTHLCTSRRA